MAGFVPETTLKAASLGFNKSLLDQLLRLLLLAYMLTRAFSSGSGTQVNI